MGGGTQRSSWPDPALTDLETGTQEGERICWGQGQRGDEKRKSEDWSLELFSGSLWKSLYLDNNGDLCPESWCGQGLSLKGPLCVSFTIASDAFELA